jgi:hypothetical protein
MTTRFKPTVEFFDRAAVPPEIAALWDEWPDLDPGTARLVRAAVSSSSPRQMRLVRDLLTARAELVQISERGWR